MRISVIGLAAFVVAACATVATVDATEVWRIGKLDSSFDGGGTARPTDNTPGRRGPGTFPPIETEFALAPAGYNKFDRDGLFIVGKSDARQEWPYVHPGPDDEWAGSRSHTFCIAFGLASAPPRGEARLLVDFVDMHFLKPPRLLIQINGRSFERTLPKGKGNDSIEGRPGKIRSFRWEVKFPAELLKAGDNQITITSLSGSWALYDTVTLEAPRGTQPAPVSEALAQRLSVARGSPLQGGDVLVTVDCGKVVNTMRGGLGASWHAMETPIPYGVKHPVFANYSHGGSGWGGYPPAEDDRAWQQIDRHARWLGLDWNRVEIEQRVYEPERGKFTFDSPEMRILYRILDWNQTSGADVFFQQMWCNAAWLAYPKFRDDPVGRVHSAPTDLDAFADGLATLMEHLVKKRGYTCIKWLCIDNEPGAWFSWWQAPPNKSLSIGPGLATVRKALDKRGLKLPLSGPDATTAFPAKAPGNLEYLNLLGAYDFHDYGADFDFRTKGHIAEQARNAAAWAELGHREGKPVFLSEFGTMSYGWVPDKPGPSCPQSALAASELVIRLANAGVDGFNRWSFLNRGDLDGQWQFIDTWDPREKKLLRDFPPHPNSYFCFGLLSRFTAKRSAVLGSRVEGGRLAGWQRVFCAALRSPRGNLTVAVVNDAPAEFAFKLAMQGLPQAVRLCRYRYGEAQRDRTDVRVSPQKEFSLGPAAGELRDELPPNSLTIYTTYKLEHDAPGAIEE